MMTRKTGIFTIFTLLLITASIPLSYADLERNQKQAYIIGCPTRGSCFSPCQTIITTGDTLTWTNKDTKDHMISSGSGQSGPDGWFSSTIIIPHGIFSHKFDRKGVFVYFDNMHPYVQGVIIVDSLPQSSFIKMQQSYFSDWCNR